MRNHRHGSVVDGHADLHSELGPNRGEHSGRAVSPTIKVTDLAWLEFEKPDLARAETFARAFGFAVAAREPDVCGTLDVTDHDSFAGFLDDVEERLGPIDVLVNNAGILPVGRLIDEPDAVTRRALAVNVYGVIVGTKVAARRMLARRSGHISTSHR
jgi:NAD(P)-dependent dehydrogenase (short-subunit alcohol dehydrogenase family)